MGRHALGPPQAAVWAAALREVLLVTPAYNSYLAAAGLLPTAWGCNVANICRGPHSAEFDFVWPICNSQLVCCTAAYGAHFFDFFAASSLLACLPRWQVLRRRNCLTLLRPSGPDKGNES